MLSKLKFSLLILIIGLSSVGIFLFSERSKAATETRYHRNSSISVNGLTANELGIANTATSNYLEIVTSLGTAECVNWSAEWRSDVIIRHADGSETVIATNVAPVTRELYTAAGGGYQSASWDAPALSLSSTDAIKIVEKIGPPGGTDYITRTWITEQLNASQLNASTWTFRRYTYLNCFSLPHVGISHYVIRLYYGSSSYNTRIENFAYTPVVDCGLRVYDGTQTISIACEDPASVSSPLRIAKNGNIYGIVLVDTTDPNASKIRIKTSSGIKALKKF